MISEASLKRGDFLVEPLFHPSDYRRPRPGSHTLRHTCVQRLVDSGFSLKTIGDFVGHGTPDATKIYAKVNIQALREVALGDGEEVL
jgi:integrase/recombinase XerD